MTAETPGVELVAGQTATELVRNGRPSGVVVAADGRDSRLARMAAGAGPRAPAQPLLIVKPR